MNVHIVSTVYIMLDIVLVIIDLRRIQILRPAQFAVIIFGEPYSCPVITALSMNDVLQIFRKHVRGLVLNLHHNKILLSLTKRRGEIDSPLLIDLITLHDDAQLHATSESAISLASNYSMILIQDKVRSGYEMNVNGVERNSNLVESLSGNFLSTLCDTLEIICREASDPKNTTAVIVQPDGSSEIVIHPPNHVNSGTQPIFGDLISHILGERNIDHVILRCVVVKEQRYCSDSIHLVKLTHDIIEIYDRIELDLAILDSTIDNLVDDNICQDSSDNIVPNHHIVTALRKRIVYLLDTKGNLVCHVLFGLIIHISTLLINIYIELDKSRLGLSYHAVGRHQYVLSDTVPSYMCYQYLQPLEYRDPS
nr:MAG TPA: hypothetical protein [Caudoviricetes sp.]